MENIRRIVVTIPSNTITQAEKPHSKLTLTEIQAQKAELKAKDDVTCIVGTLYTIALDEITQTSHKLKNYATADRPFGHLAQSIFYQGHGEYADFQIRVAQLRPIKENSQDNRQPYIGITIIKERKEYDENNEIDALDIMYILFKEDKQNLYVDIVKETIFAKNKERFLLDSNAERIFNDEDLLTGFIARRMTKSTPYKVDLSFPPNLSYTKILPFLNNTIPVLQQRHIIPR